MSDTTSSLEASFSAKQVVHLDAQQARRIFSQGEEAVVFALLALAKQVKEATENAAVDPSTNPSTPSAMVPPYQKPTGKKRKKKSSAWQS